MNLSRSCYVVVHRLPYDLTLRFSKFGAPSEQDLRPIFRKLGSEDCIARLKVHSRGEKEVVIRLPEALACHGEGRYEVLLHDKCCRECDRAEVWFKAGCEIVEVTGKEPEEVCHDC